MGSEGGVCGLFGAVLFRSWLCAEAERVGVVQMERCADFYGFRKSIEFVRVQKGVSD